jgi:hypothetical protein
MIFPNLQPPTFQCSDVTATSLKLHYHSNRPGLAPFVNGLLAGLSKMFETPITVQVTQSETGGAGHDVFLISWVPPLWK